MLSAGMTGGGKNGFGKLSYWVPACAGMTKKLGDGDGFVDECFIAIDDISNNVLNRHPQQI